MKIKINKIIVYILVIFSCIRTSIYLFYDYKYILITRAIVMGMLLIMFFRGISLFQRLKLRDKFLVLINYLNKFPIILLSLASLSYNTIHNITIYIYFFYNSYKFKKKCYKILLNFLVIISFFSILEYFYIILGGNLNFMKIGYTKEQFGVYYYLGIFNSFLVEVNSGHRLQRLLSIYNEPGYYGTFLGIFILFTKKEKKYKIFILYLAGILTLSTAFFYFASMKFIVEGMNRKKFLKSLFIGIIVINFLFVLGKNNELIKTKIISKIERILIKKSLNRTNRKKDIEQIEEFKRNGNLILGERKEFLNNGGMSIWMEIYKIGFLGILINSIIFLRISNFFEIKDSKVRTFILIALTSIFQRPNILDSTTLICLYCGPIMYYTKNKKYLRGNNAKNK